MNTTWRFGVVGTESLNYQLRKIIKNSGHFPRQQRRGQAPLADNLHHRDELARERETERGDHSTEAKPPDAWSKASHHQLEQALAQLTLS